MKKLSKARIQRILNSHCVTIDAQLFRVYADSYGDFERMEKYLECPVYFSALLHRYNPYIDFDASDIATVYKRHTPMAILPYETPVDIKSGDILCIENKTYIISFSEDIKGYYYLLSLIAKE